MVVNCPHFTHVDLYIINRRAWHWPHWKTWTELQNLHGVSVTEHLVNFEGRLIEPREQVRDKVDRVELPKLFS